MNILTSKTPFGFLAKLGSFGYSWRTNFFKKLNVINERSNHRVFIGYQPQKVIAPHSMESTRL
jgi:hypothetical protein